jgi:hypothetical protein
MKKGDHVLAWSPLIKIERVTALLASGRDTEREPQEAVRTGKPVITNVHT